MPKGTLKTRGLKVAKDNFCWKSKSKVKEKKAGEGFSEPKPRFSGVSRNVNAKQKIITLLFLVKKVERT